MRMSLNKGLSGTLIHTSFCFFGKPELNTISWAEGNPGDAKVLNLH